MPKYCINKKNMIKSTIEAEPPTNKYRKNCIFDDLGLPKMRCFIALSLAIFLKISTALAVYFAKLSRIE